MPIIKTETKLIYYAHTPKCAGTSVANYIRDRFGKPAFWNGKYMSIPPGERWSNTSPQHIDVMSLGLLFPPNFFDASFAVVRHPVARLVSVYHFQLEIEKTIPTGQSFAFWLENIFEHPTFAYDHHLRPMSELIPEGSKLFYLEDGLEGIIPWLDTVTGIKKGARQLPHVNKRTDRNHSKRHKITPSDAEKELITRYYKVDFERFGYALDQETAPSTPKNSEAGKPGAMSRLMQSGCRAVEECKRIIYK